MRLHIWQDDKPPRIISEGDIKFLSFIDYPHWNAFEIGDQIQYLTDLGTAIYFVVDVEPCWDGEREAQIITIQEPKL